MTKVLTNSQGKIYINQAGKALVSETANVITATNNTGSAITSGDKVWVNENNGSYSIENLKELRNFNVIGSPTINDSTGIVSGFSTSNYIKTPDTFNYTQPFQIYVKFTTPSSINKQTPVIGTVTSFSIVPFYFISNFNLCGFGSSNGSSWNLFSNVALKTCLANTTYTMMFEFTGSAYVWYEYENGTWVELTRVTSSTPCYSGGEVIYGKAGTEYWISSIDLSETYINVNGNLWWKPYLLGVTENSLTGYAQENIASGSTGDVKTVLGA